MPSRTVALGQRKKRTARRQPKASDSRVRSGGARHYARYCKLAQAILMGRFAMSECKKGGLPQSNPPILMAHHKPLSAQPTPRLLQTIQKASSLPPAFAVPFSLALHHARRRTQQPYLLTDSGRLSPPVTNKQNGELLKNVTRRHCIERLKSEATKTHRKPSRNPWLNP